MSRKAAFPRRVFDRRHGYRCLILLVLFIRLEDHLTCSGFLPQMRCLAGDHWHILGTRVGRGSRRMSIWAQHHARLHVFGRKGSSVTPGFLSTIAHLADRRAFCGEVHRRCDGRHCELRLDDVRRRRLRLSAFWNWRDWRSERAAIGSPWPVSTFPAGLA